MAVQLGVPVACAMHISQFPMGKVGGTPLWLLPEAPQNCEGCENELDFILQVYCPWDLPHTYHRYLYVLSCSVCREIHIYRAQLPQSNSLYPEPDNSDLTDDQLLELLSAPRERPTKSDLGLNIIDEDEDITRAARELFGLDLTDAQAVDEFLDSLPQDVPEPAQALPPAEDAEDEGFEGVKERSEDVSFELLRVSAMRQRKQCVRYDRGGVPLWYSDRHRPTFEVQDCERCGARRHFEFQVMPQVIDVAGLEADFGSIYVFTCTRSCESATYVREACVVQDSL